MRLMRCSTGYRELGARFTKESKWRKRKREREREGGKGSCGNGGKEERQGNASERGKRMAGRKGVLRNILASPRVPSCVLNHFPVDSAVCNPIISVSPPGKLLFYSRTTRAPDIPYPAFSFSPSSSSSFRFTLYSAFAEKSILTLLANSFFPTTSRSFAQSRARARLFRSIRLYRCEFFRFPETGSMDSRTGWTSGNESGNGEPAWKESRRKLNFIY